MKKLANLLISGAVSLCVLMPAMARAETLRVTFSIIDKNQNLDVEGYWDQSSNPTPGPPSSPPYMIGQYTDIPIFNYHSTGKTPTVTYTDVVWNNALSNGGFDLFNPGNGFWDYNVQGSQAYTGLESNPVFAPGNYKGTEIFSGAPATYTLTATVVGAPGPVPGAGFAGLAALALAGFYARTRRA